MKNLNGIAEELFNKIRGRYPRITIGDESSKITNDPQQARFFDFDFAEGKKVNVSLDDNALTMIYSNKLFDDVDDASKQRWYDFLKEIRQFAKKRMLNFDTRDITKSNLDKRDYEYQVVKKQGTENTMSESKMYGTSRTSYQDIGNAKMVIKHAEPINREQAGGRTQSVHSIYIESDAGERFKYPYRHLNGARAMAMHVSEGGNQYDDFGKHITGLSEELNKLRKFKTYMSRSNVMAEGLAGYMDVVNERLVTVRKTVESLQRKAYYTETFANFEQTVLEEVPEDIATDWTAQLTIKQFNEELKGVFPYIYKLVSEANRVKELGPEDILGEGGGRDMDCTKCDGKGSDKEGKECKTCNGSGEAGPGEDDYGAESMKENDVDECGCGDPAMEYEQYLDDIISNSNHERDPMQEYAQAFEDFKMAAASAAKAGATEFEYPANSGKMHKTTMSKQTASKLMSSMDMPMGEDEQLDENPLSWIMRGVSKVIPMLKPGAKQGLDAIAGAAGKAAKGAPGALKKGAEVVGKGAWNNKGKLAIGGGAAYGVNKVGDGVEAVKQYADQLADKIPTVDDIKTMMPSIPNAGEIAKLAGQYALPAAAVLAVLYGGYKVIGAIFGSDEKEGADDNTADVSPQGQGDELKDKNDTPLDEFIKSYYDYTTNAFPKGETAVITAVQKKYGDEAITDATSVIKELLSGQDEEMARIQHLAGLR